MSNSISNSNAKTSTLDTVAKLRDNINYIEKFGLLLSVAQQINSRLILIDIYIDNPRITSDIKFNSYILYCLENYQLSQNLVVNYILEVFYKEFYR